MYGKGNRILATFLGFGSVMPMTCEQTDSPVRWSPLPSTQSARGVASIPHFRLPSRTLIQMAARTFVFPQLGDDFAAIAKRELVDVPDAEQQLLSWNLHLAARAGLGRAVGLLPSDIVFTEPPRAQPAP